MQTSSIENGTVFNQIILKDRCGSLWQITAYQVQVNPRGPIQLEHVYRKLRDNNVRRRHRAIDRAFKKRIYSHIKRLKKESDKSFTFVVEKKRG